MKDFKQDFRDADTFRLDHVAAQKVVQPHGRRAGEDTVTEPVVLSLMFLKQIGFFFFFRNKYILA